MGSSEWQTVVGRRQRRGAPLLGAEQDQAQAQGKGRSAGNPQVGNGELAQASGTGTCYSVPEPQRPGGGGGGGVAGGKTDVNDDVSRDKAPHSSGEGRAGAAKRAPAQKIAHSLGPARDRSGGAGTPLPGWGPSPGQRKAGKGRGSKHKHPGASSAHGPSVDNGGGDPEAEPRAVTREEEVRHAAGRDGSRVLRSEAEESAADSAGGKCGEYHSARVVSPGEVAAILRRIQDAKEQVAESLFFRHFTAQMGILGLSDWLAPPGSSHPSGSTCTPRETTAQGSAPELQEGSAPAAECRQDGAAPAAEVSVRATPAAAAAPSEKRCQVQLVLYGVGSVGDSRVSRCQLALALLLRDHITECLTQRRPPADSGDDAVRAFVFDPVLELEEREALASLGLCCLDSNQNGSLHFGPEAGTSQGSRGTASSGGSGRPSGSGSAPLTLFFMPHCEAFLYSNVVRAHEQQLDKIAILGNSFRMYEDRWSFRPKEEPEAPALLELFARKVVMEHPVDPCNFPMVSAFNDMSWHFFSP